MNTYKQTKLEGSIVDCGGRSEVRRFLADIEPFFHAKPVVYVDAGAHKGHIFREVLGSRLKLKAAHLIEPNPASFAELEATVRALKAEAFATCHNVALAAESRKLRLHEAGDMTRVIEKAAQSDKVPDEASDQTAAPRSRQKSFEIEAVTLDALLGELPKGHASILKIDVEGYERELLAGAATLLGAQALDVIYIEAGIDPANSQQTYYRDLEDTLRTAGYRLFRIYEQKNEWEEDSPFLRRVNLAFLSERFAARNPYRLTRRLAAAQQEVAELRKALGEARQECEATGARGAELETRLEKARETVDAKTADLTRQEAEHAAALAQQEAGHVTALTRRDLALADGRQHLEARAREMRALEAQLATRSEEIVKMTRRLEAQAGESKELEKQLADRSEEIVKLTRGLESHQIRIDELMRSTSWRVSAPVRTIGRLLRRR